MILRLLLLYVPYLLLTTNGLGQVQQPPERALEDFLVSLSREDMRSLTDSRNTKDNLAASSALSKTLKAQETGKKCTIKCTSNGETHLAFDNRIALNNDPDKSVVRANGLKVRVSVRAEVAQAMASKIKECRAGRKIFVAGTVSDIRIGYGQQLIGQSSGRPIFGPSITTLHITIIADDIGPDK